jgi:hypothetical protein
MDRRGDSRSAYQEKTTFMSLSGVTVLTLKEEQLDLATPIIVRTRNGLINEVYLSGTVHADD